MPSNSPTGGATTLQGGLCTNGSTGAFSNAALASQALSDVTQASTDQSTNTAVEAISARRRTEEVQQQAPPAAPSRAKIAAARTKPNAQENGAVDIQGPDSARPYEPHWGVWAEGFGDYDRLTGGPGGRRLRVRALVYHHRAAVALLSPATPLCR